MARAADNIRNIYYTAQRKCKNGVYKGVLNNNKFSRMFEMSYIAKHKNCCFKDKKKVIYFPLERTVITKNPCIKYVAGSLPCTIKFKAAKLMKHAL